MGWGVGVQHCAPTRPPADSHLPCGMNPDVHARAAGRYIIVGSEIIQNTSVCASLVHPVLSDYLENVWQIQLTRHDLERSTPACV